MLNKLIDCLKLCTNNKNKIWIMYENEGSDNFFEKYISKNIQTSTYCIVSKKAVYLIVNELDSRNLDEIKKKYSKMLSDETLNLYVYDLNETLINIISEIIYINNYPEEVMFSYSTINDKSTDIISHGDYIKLTNIIKSIYKNFDKKVRFNSAEKIIYEFSSRKTNSQIERLKYVSSFTIKILEETFSNIKIGMSEKEIADMTAKNMILIMQQEKEKGIIKDYELAWFNCPIVLIGKNLEKGGHSLPSSKKLEKGETIYFDFGIACIFDDDEKICSDIQRMGYSLNDDEKVPPKNVMKVFDTLVYAIELGIENFKPGVKGYKIDFIVRNAIIKEGFKEYNHATGHPVCNEVHDIGCILSKKTSKRANLELVENGVYTIEPRIQIKNGGSIEEMVQVTKFGGKPLCKPQTKLYLIKS